MGYREATTLCPRPFSITVRCMNGSPLAQLMNLDVPVLLVGADDTIVYANALAQNFLLSVDVTDMPVHGFISNWEMIRPKQPRPECVDLEVLLRTGEYAAARAAVFQLQWENAALVGVAFARSFMPSF